MLKGEAGEAGQAGETTGDKVVPVLRYSVPVNIFRPRYSNNMHDARLTRPSWSGMHFDLFSGTVQEQACKCKVQYLSLPAAAGMHA